MTHCFIQLWRKLRVIETNRCHASIWKTLGFCSYRDQNQMCITRDSGLAGMWFIQQGSCFSAKNIMTTTGSSSFRFEIWFQMLPKYGEGVWWYKGNNISVSMHTEKCSYRQESKKIVTVVAYATCHPEPHPEPHHTPLQIRSSHGRPHGGRSNCLHLTSFSGGQQILVRAGPQNQQPLLLPTKKNDCQDYLFSVEDL